MIIIRTDHNRCTITRGSRDPPTFMSADIVPALLSTAVVSGCARCTAIIVVAETAATFTLSVLREFLYSSIWKIAKSLRQGKVQGPPLVVV
jgi:hypothetical protein